MASTPDHYAVIGNPVNHSLSPEIHTLFAQQTSQSISYEKLTSPVDGFNTYISQLHKSSYHGLNVTVPFKAQAWALAEEKTQRATLAGAVNTLSRTDSGWNGDNTDGVGLINDLKRLQMPLQDSHILILGAGGATRGVLLPLLSCQPASLHIANRTAHKAIELADSFSTYGTVSGSGLDFQPVQGYDLIINATAAGIDGKVPVIPEDALASNGCCYDMFYAAEPTVFVNWGNQHGTSMSSDGLGMLVEQAAVSFEIWRGIVPDTDVVIEAIRKIIS